MTTTLYKSDQGQVKNIMLLVTQSGINRKKIIEKVIPTRLMFSESTRFAFFFRSRTIWLVGQRSIPMPKHRRHSRTFLPCQLAILRPMWPAHHHFSLLILRSMSVSLVCLQILSFQSNPGYAAVTLPQTHMFLGRLLSCPCSSRTGRVPKVTRGSSQH